LDVDTSMFLEDAWKNGVDHANFENKIQVEMFSAFLTNIL